MFPASSRSSRQQAFSTCIKRELDTVHNLTRPSQAQISLVTMQVPADERGGSTTGGDATAAMPDERALEDAPHTSEAAVPSLASTRSLRKKSSDKAKRRGDGGGGLQMPSSGAKDRWLRSSKLGSAISPSSESIMTGPSGPTSPSGPRSPSGLTSPSGAISPCSRLAGLRGAARSSLLSSGWAKTDPWRFPPPRNALSTMRDFSPRSTSTNAMSSPADGRGSTSVAAYNRRPGDLKVSARNELSRPSNVFMALVAASVVASAVTALIIVFGKTRTAANGGCRSEECAQYALRLQESINESVDPCADFTRYVCDGWRRRHKLSVAHEAFMSTFDSMSSFVRALVVPPRGHSAVERSAAFYRSCVSVLRGERDEMPRVAGALAAAGIAWPDVSATAADLLRTFLYVHVKLRWNVLFSVDVIKNGGSVTVVMRPSLHTVPIKKHLEFREKPEMAEEYFDNLVSAFATKASKLGHRITFEETNDTASNVMNTLLVGFIKGYVVPQRIDVPLLKMVRNLTEARWNATLHSVGIGPRVSFRTTHPLFMTQFLALRNSLGESKIHQFVSWFTVQVAALYTNQRLIANYYGTEKTASLWHGAFCFSKAYLLSGTAAFNASFNYMQDSDIRAEALELLWGVRISFLSALQRWPYSDNASVNEMLAISELDFAAKTFAVFDERNEGSGSSALATADMTDSLVDNWIAAAVPYKEDVTQSASTSIAQLSFTTLSSDGDVALMPYAFSFPFFDVRSIPAMNYAGVGSHFADALSQHALERYVTSVHSPLHRFLDCAGVSLETLRTTPGKMLIAYSAAATQPLF
ncbi:uncharacterized protein LOC142575486 [Dermacentor variabilis]|uniref:uncharacterized protein LOC142575486 n=1 Tax=Dermacentor variabilis TaxID=34621 RepID=UPI003F5B3455